MIFRRTFVSLLTCLTLVSSTLAVDGSFDRLSPDAGLGDIEFKHLEVNDKGDYVAVAGSQVYVGNAVQGTLRKIFDNNRVGFVLSHDDYQSDPGSNQQRRISFDLLATRLDLNENGDFVLASNANIWVGNVAGDGLKSVFQADNVLILGVAINDTGHYIAATNRNVYGGHVGEAQATHLVDSAAGSFGTFSVLGTGGDWYVESGETHLAINAAGQFVAASSQALYVGSVPQKASKRLHQDDKLGFRHVSLNAQGQFIAVSVKNVYRGNIQ